MLDRASLTCSELLQAHSNRVCKSDFSHVCLRYSNMVGYVVVAEQRGARLFGIYNVLLLISNSFVVLLSYISHFGELRYPTK